MIEDVLKDAKFYAIDSLSIKPTDIIIVKSSQLLTTEQAEQVKIAMKHYFVLNTILVISGNVDILVARKEQ